LRGKKENDTVKSSGLYLESDTTRTAPCPESDQRSGMGLEAIVGTTVKKAACRKERESQKGAQLKGKKIEK